MTKEDIVFKIEILGHLLEELHYWSEQEQDLDLADERFDEALAAVKEMREIVLTDLEDYFEYIKESGEPIYLPFVQIRRDIKNANFGE